MKQQRFSPKYCFIYSIPLIVLLGFTVPCHGAKVEQFSAEQVLIEPGGNAEQVGKIYVAPDKVRFEKSSSTDQGSMVMIFRKDLKMLRILMPETKAYIENPLSEADLQKTFQQLPKDMKEEDLGRETINGFECKKKRVEGSIEFSQGHKQTFSSVVWISDRIGFPIRTQSEDGRMTELRNIMIGSQPDELFEVPSGYSKIANPLGNMGGSPGQNED
jgi:hypothetical protein